jgi:hypothetical protein
VVASPFLDRWSRAGVLLAALVAVAGCSASPDGASNGSSSTAPATASPSVSVPGAAQESFSAPQDTEATIWASTYLTALITAHPQLTGMRVEGLYPVFDQGGAAPIGVMSRMVAQAQIPEVDLDLIRFSDGAPVLLPSRVEHLRALEAIYQFDITTVIHLGISPRASDAADPGTATRVTPLPGQQKTDGRFGGSD